jgi:acylphosphatase
VGYRAFVADHAAERGLLGWVRNRRDGSVELILSGGVDDVAAVVAACRVGPRLARVDEVQIRDVPDEGFGDFTVRATV